MSSECLDTEGCGRSITGFGLPAETPQHHLGGDFQGALSELDPLAAQARLSPVAMQMERMGVRLSEWGPCCLLRQDPLWGEHFGLMQEQ